jgi:hypothetical protein
MAGASHYTTTISSGFFPSSRQTAPSAQAEEPLDITIPLSSYYLRYPCVEVFDEE